MRVRTKVPDAIDLTADDDRSTVADITKEDEDNGNNKCTRKSKRIGAYQQNKPKYSMGTMIRKEFPPHGLFDGEVDGFRILVDQGTLNEERLYHIHYEDSDTEEVDEADMPQLIDNFAVHRKNDYENKWGHYAQKKKKRQSSASKVIKSSALKKAKIYTTNSNSKKVGSKQSINGDSSLWAGIFGEEKGRELKGSLEALVKANPPPPDLLPPHLHGCIPLMVEFFLLMFERQTVFLGKQTQVPPLSRNHFCNNYRELDRGTAYLRSQIVDLHKDLTSDEKMPLTRDIWVREVLGLAYVYRLCNRQASFTSPQNPSGGVPRLGHWTKEHENYVRAVEQRRRTNSHAPRFFTGAHQSISHDEYIEHGRNAAKTIPKVAAQIVRAGSDLKMICDILKQLGCVGAFRAWQLACDLEEAGCLGRDVPDDYTLLGPGAKNGLLDVFGASVIRNHNSLELVRYLRDTTDYCLDLVGLKFPYWNGRPVTLKVIEHVLCEFSKFQRIDCGSDLRTRDSQSSLDQRPCDVCQSSKTIAAAQGRVRCDSCFMVVCHECKDDAFHLIRAPQDELGCNRCHGCHEIDGLSFD